MGQPVPVSQIMHAGLLLQCKPETAIAEAAARMAENSVSSILVSRDGAVVGIWTERDALTINFADPDQFNQPVSLVMRAPVLSLPATMDTAQATTQLRSKNQRHALVTDETGKPVGILSLTDLARNQGLEPYLRLREVSAVIQQPPVVLPAAQPLTDVALRMHQRAADAAVVRYDDGGLGIVTERDMVRFIARHTSNTRIGELASRPLLTAQEDDPLIHARDMLLNHRIRHLGVLDQTGAIIGLIGYNDMLSGAEQMYLDDLRQALEQHDKALARSSRTLQLAERVIESSFEGIMVTDKNARIEFVNPAFTQLTGYSPEEVIGRTPEVLSSGRHDSEFYTRLWQSLEHHGYWRGEIWNRRKTGELYLELLTITAITDDNGNATHYAGLFTDITQNRKNEEQIRQLAYYDALTGVPNRRLLEDRLEHAIRHAHRTKKLLAVMFMDLDKFKDVNDRLGHATGDELLVQFTARVRSCLREDDTLARLGGDEFIILLPEVINPEDVLSVAERLVRASTPDYVINGHQLAVSTSIGISLYPDDGKTSEELLNGADIAMYQAKQSGRDRYKLFNPKAVDNPANRQR